MYRVRLALVLALPLIALAAPRGAAAEDAPPSLSLPQVGCDATHPVATLLGRGGDLVCALAGSAATGNAAGVADGVIRGVVTEDGTGTPLEGVCVIARDGSSLDDPSAVTDGSGSYEIAGLQQHGYKLWFTDCGGPGYHRPEWNSNAPNYDEGSAVTPFPEATIDASLAPGGGAISGAVTDTATGDPIAGICAFVVDERGYEVAAAIGTDEGVYSAEGLAPGQYHVLFISCSGETGHAYEWYSNAATFTASATVQVQEGQKTTVNAALARGGSVHGTAAPLGGICVGLFSDETGVLAGYDLTGDDGGYDVGGLRPGAYLVRFVDCSTPRHHLPEWYDDEDQVDRADLVIVQSTSSNIGLGHTTLSLGGSIAGRVGTSVTLSSMCIDIYTTDSDGVFSTGTNATGDFEAGGLRAGAYHVRFQDCRREPALVAEWWPARESPDLAVALLVETGETRVDINATLVEGGLVNGTATSAVDGGRLRGICVLIYDTIGDLDWYGFARTDGLGEYTVPLAQDSYLAWFVDCNWESSYHPRWYGEPTESASFFVSDGAKRPDVDVALELAIAGDADCSRTIDSVDAALVLQFGAALSDYLPCIFNADVDGDGFLSAIDVALILQYVAGLLDEL